jgi:hypothetical protein
MSKRVQENALALLLFATFAFFFVFSLDYSPRARLVPLPISALGMALTLVQLFWQNFRASENLSVDMLEFMSGETAEQKAAASGATGFDREEEAAPASGWERHLNREAAAFLIVAVLLACALLLGPLPAVFIFLATYFALSRLCAWPTAILYAVIGVGLLYGLFGQLLGVQFNRGLIAPLISPYVFF